MAGWRYVNCYHDVLLLRTLSVSRGSHSDLTPRSCAALCEGHEYFGVEHGNECYCGDRIVDNRDAPGADCNMGCTGDDLVLCGAGWRLTVYRRVAVEIQAVEGWDYVGCFLDPDESARTLPEGPEESDTMTAEMCAGLCEGKRYFGVEYRKQCFCGDELDMDKKVLRRDLLQCDATCAGDARYVCGNGWRLTAYRKKTPPPSDPEPSASAFLPSTTSTTARSSTVVSVSSTSGAVSSPSPSPQCNPQMSCDECDGFYPMLSATAECRSAPYAGCACVPTLATCGEPRECHLNDCRGTYIPGTIDEAECSLAYPGCPCIPTAATCGPPQSCDADGCEGSYLANSNEARCTRVRRGCLCTPTEAVSEKFNLQASPHSKLSLLTIKL